MPALAMSAEELRLLADRLLQALHDVTATLPAAPTATLPAPTAPPLAATRAAGG